MNNSNVTLLVSVSADYPQLFGQVLRLVNVTGVHVADIEAFKNNMNVKGNGLPLARFLAECVSNLETFA